MWQGEKMTVIDNQRLESYRDQNTRPVDLGNGQSCLVRMTPDLWEDLEFLQVVEGVTTAELAKFAFEEQALSPHESFDRCFRAVVAHLANRWMNE
jgi:hypothetical protein